MREWRLLSHFVMVYLGSSTGNRTASLPNKPHQGFERLEPVNSETALTDVSVFSPPLSELPLDQKTLEHHLGYRDGTAPEPVSSAISDLLPHVGLHADVKCGFRILPEESVVVHPETVSCGDVTLMMGSVITKQLRNSSTLALTVATAGPGMEQWSNRLMAEGDLLRGFIVDAIASDLVGIASEWLERKIAGAVKARGWSLTNGYSPGYCDWPVSDQHNLFSLLPHGFCGVTLTESALMVPVKSLSGVIGLGAGAKKGAYQCSICELKDCYRRREEPVAPEETG